MPHTVRSTGGAILAFAIAAVVFTWPLAARFDRAGRIDSGDARHGMWNVAWVAHALSSDPAALYDANIFHPYPNALAFSEPNILAGILALPVWVATGNPLAAFNWVVLLSFVCSALATYALVMYLTSRPIASGVAALIFAFSPHVFSHLAHVQLLMTFGLPLALLALHRYVDAPGWRRGAWLGGALGVQGLACGYYGIFAGLMVGWGALWFAAGSGRWRVIRYWAGLALAVVVAAAIVGPFLAPFASVRDSGFERTLDDARLFRADWRAYLASPLIVHRWILPWLGQWREVLFPGVAALALSGVAIVRFLGPASRSASSAPAMRQLTGFYLSLAVLAGWASFGPDAGLYRLLFETLPFFGLLRAPSRFGLLVTGALAVLAGLALADLERRLTGRRRQAIVASAVVVAIAESVVGPLTLVDRPPQHVVYERLAQLPAGAVAEFPFFADPFDRHRHTEYMLESTAHWKPLVNGYSDHTPAGAFEDMGVLATFPAPAAWDVLERRGARYVVVHWNMYPAGTAPLDEVARLAADGLLRPIVERPDATLYEIVGR